MNRIGDSGNIAIESSRAAADINRYINHNRITTYWRKNDPVSSDWVEVVSDIDTQEVARIKRWEKLEDAIQAWKDDFSLKFPTTDQFDCVEWRIQPDISYELNEKSGTNVYGVWAIYTRFRLFGRK